MPFTLVLCTGAATRVMADQVRKVFDVSDPQLLAATVVAIYASRLLLAPPWPLPVRVAGGIATAYVVGQCWCMWHAPVRALQTQHLLLAAAFAGVSAFVLLGIKTGVDVDPGRQTPVILGYALFLAVVAGRRWRAGRRP